MQLNFSEQLLIINETSPEYSYLKTKFECSNEKFEFNNAIYTITQSIEKDRFFWTYAKYGKQYPHAPTVFDKSQNLEISNPRTTSQIEQDEQFFAIYDVHKKRLFISSLIKRSLYEEFLKNRIAPKIVVKNVYSSLDEFLNHIKNINSVRFVARDDLFNVNDGIRDIFPNPNNIFGLGVPRKFLVEANFTAAKITDQARIVLKKMGLASSDGLLSSFVCVGKDDKGIESVFNQDTLVKKISIDAKVDENMMFDAENIKSQLINELESRE